MDARFKKVCVLLDDSDREHFMTSLGAEFDTVGFLPLDFSSLMQLIFTAPETQYHRPSIDSEMQDNYLTKQIYDQSQAFLADLFAGDERLRPMAAKHYYPAEYFWHCLFTNVHRLIYYCRHFLNQHQVETVLLLKREKREMIGELEVDLKDFTSIVQDFFERAGISVTIIDCPRSIALSKTSRWRRILAQWKAQLKFSYTFCCWKLVSLRGRDYSTLLVQPAYDNKINFDLAHLHESCAVPQAFMPHGLPFYHSVLSLIKYLRNKNQQPVKLEIIGSKKFLLSVGEYSLDVYRYFTPTIERYLQTVEKNKITIDAFWRNCPRHDDLRNLIFSFSPVFLYAYFLIEKIKENGGRVIVWQHGGLNGYADHFYRYILDYKLADVFLAYGESHVSELNLSADANCDKNHIVGTNMIYDKKHGHRLGKSGSRPDGYYLLLAPQTNYYQSAIKWDAVKQYSNIKIILDDLMTGAYGRVDVNGVKNHTMYKLLAKCLQQREINYTEISLDDIIAQQPKFLILDGVATTLLETLAKFDGLIFVLNCQETWLVHPAAQDLLKQRVFYAETVDELKNQLRENLLGDSANARSDNNLFQNQYIKHFSYQEYKRILQEIK